MKIANAFDGKQLSKGRSIVSLALLTTMVAWAAPAASAQDAASGKDVDAAGSLTAGVRCSNQYAAEDIGFNIKKLALSDEAIVVALNHIAADSAQCATIKGAAAELVKAYPTAPPVNKEDLAADAAKQRTARILAEADKGVGNLKFKVDPPPRNLTRGREHTVNFGQ